MYTQRNKNPVEILTCLLLEEQTTNKKTHRKLHKVEEEKVSTFLGKLL